MEGMREDEAYDWVDDEDLDTVDTLRKFNMLDRTELGPVVARVPLTATATRVVMIQKRFFGLQQPDAATVL
jgi:hypothetical protein